MGVSVKIEKNIEAKAQLYLRRLAYICNQEMKNALADLGQLTVEDAVNRPESQSFINHTGNLRSSIGYGVYRDGKKVAGGGFQPTEAPESNGHLGQWYGRRELTKAYKGTSENASVKEIASDFTYNGARFTLVVVAGMFYAGYVEAKPTKDVLAQAQLKQEAAIKPRLRAATQRIKERIAKIRI